MLIVLPPSEGKATPTRGKQLDLASLSFPSLSEARAEMLDALVSLSSTSPDAADVLGLGPTQSDEIARNAALGTAPTTRADRLYTGVLYDALSLDTLDAGAKRRAGRRLLVTSSLFGIVRPADRLPSYRLSGGVTLPGIGGVAAHWRRHLDEPMREAVADGLLVDLRSTTYAAFWKPPRDLSARVVSVRVLQEQDGKRSIVSHFNKATKGRLTRALLESGADPRRPARFVELLRDLGWTVEANHPDGTQLDVIVTAL